MFLFLKGVHILHPFCWAESGLNHSMQTTGTNSPSPKERSHPLLSGVRMGRALSPNQRSKEPRGRKKRAAGLSDPRDFLVPQP